MAIHRAKPSWEILSGDSADVYFARAERIMEREGLDPVVTAVLAYAAIVDACVGASTPAGARLAGLSPTGTMPHSLVLIFGDTVRAAEAFDRDLSADIPRLVLVDTFKDEAEEALRVAH